MHTSAHAHMRAHTHTVKNINVMKFFFLKKSISIGGRQQYFAPAVLRQNLPQDVAEDHLELLVPFLLPQYQKDRLRAGWSLDTIG